MTSNNPHSDNDKKATSAKLELGLVNAWQSQAWWLWLFLPLSGLYGLVTWLKRKLYQTHILSSYQAPIPVMVVGNITIGGSGKTPLIIELVRYLQHKGIKVGVISRGYGGNESLMPQAVTLQSQPSDVGDEPCLIVRETGVTMGVSPNRQQAIECVLQQTPDIQLIIADDGLQHYKLARDIEWIVVDSSRGFGNKQLLPTGFLREPMSRLKEATVIYHQAPTEHQSPTDYQASIDKHQDMLSMHLQPAPIQSLFKGSSNQSFNTRQPSEAHNILDPAESKRVYGVSGIGYPQRFFDTLTSLGFEVIKKPMPDHHEFTINDLKDLTDYPIVITSKDAVKIAPLASQNEALSQLSIWVLPVTAQLSQACYTILMEQLKALGVTPKS